jgi:regulatory protein
VEDDFTGEARLAAIKLLARREHATLELRRKLIAKGFSADVAASVLTALGEEGYLSDERYAETYIRARTERGYGPVRICAELRERGISDDLIGRGLDEWDEQWIENAERARRKRFGKSIPSDWKERTRQARFLQYRGFSSEHIRRLFCLDGDAG